jgi:3,4-dihydroxy 2-butanone 4-phosphate synthase/GTP cyclohydrolase II
MAAIAAEGRGVVLYLRGHEGRGIGLLSKLRAYQLQDAGADTVDANLELGLPADAREYSTGAQMLADLGVRSLRLLTNNPAKMAGLSGFGIEVTGRVSLPVAATEDNLRYLIAKRDRLGHQLDNLFIPDASAPAVPAIPDASVPAVPSIPDASAAAVPAMPDGSGSRAATPPQAASPPLASATTVPRPAEPAVPAPPSQAPR